MSFTDLNVNAKSFYPDAEFEKAMLAVLQEKDVFEKVWWNNNKDMFEDSFEDTVKFMKSPISNWTEIERSKSA